MRLFTLAIAAFALALPLAAQDKAAAKAKKPKRSPEVVKGITLLKAGKLVEARDAFRQAAAKNPTDRGAANAVRSLSRAIQLAKLAKNPKNPKYNAAVAWLHRFYSVNGLKQQDQALLAGAWKATKNPSFGNLYAHSLMAADEDTDALEVFQEILKVKNDPNIHVNCAILLLRLRNEEEAKEHLEAIPKDLETSSLCYNVACAYALMGQQDKAIHCLTRSFQLTPPSRLAGLKKQAKNDADLAGLRKNPGFAKAMAAKSTVAEPRTGGCAGCPSKGSCSKEKEGGCGEAKPAPKKPAPKKPAPKKGS